MAAASCTPEPAAGEPCNSDSECGAAEVCLEGFCQINDVSTPPDRRDSGPGGLVDSGPAVDGGTPGGDSGTPGADSGTPGGDGGTPGGDSGTPGGDSGAPGGDSGSPGSDSGTPAGLDGGPVGVDAGPPAADCTAYSFDGHAYYGCTTTASWPEARAACQAVGMDLMSIGSTEEKDFSQMLFAAVGDHWIGLNDQAQEGLFSWSDGDGFGFEHFEGGQPNGGGGQNCIAVLYSDGHWKDEPCADPYGIVCEAPQLLTPPAGAYCELHPSLCPCETRVFGGSVYALCAPATAGSDVDAFCSAFGLGSAAVVDAQGEQAWLDGQDALFGAPRAICERAAGALPSDCTLNGDHALCTTQRTYDEARVACQRGGMDLVILDDASEFDIVRGLASDQLWVGWDDRAGEGLGITPQGTAALFAPFTESQPNNVSANEDCGTTYREPSTGEWGLRDGNCTGDRRFVCEVPPSTAPTAFNGDLCRDFPEACPCALYPSDDVTFGICPSLMDAREHEAFCERIGMTQATPELQLDGVRLQALAREQFAPFGQAIGLRDQDVGAWQWITGDTPAYFLWDAIWSQPDNGGDLCARLYERNGMRWHDFPCTQDVPTACQMATTPDGACTDADGDGYGAGCALGPDCDDTAWHKNPGRFDVCDGVDNDCSGTPDDDELRCACEVETVADGNGTEDFLLCDEDVDFETAQHRCLAMGTELARVDSVDVNDGLVSAVTLAGLTAPWIGAHDRITEGAFIWADGTDLAFTSWALMEPNASSGGEDCARLTNPAVGVGWNDVGCDETGPYLCGPF